MIKAIDFTVNITVIHEMITFRSCNVAVLCKIHTKPYILETVNICRNHINLLRQRIILN